MRNLSIFYLFFAIYSGIMINNIVSFIIPTSTKLLSIRMKDSKKPIEFYDNYNKSLKLINLKERENRRKPAS